MFEAYSVAIRLSLINGVTSGLTNISRAFLKAHGDATKLQKALDDIKFKLAAGAAIGGSGLFGLAMLEKTLPAAREYAHQLQQMNAAGMKQVEIAKAVSEAWGAAKAVPTASATENLAAIRELRMVFGNTQDAINNLITVQKLQAVLQNSTNGRIGGDQAYTVAKALEMRGATRTPGEFATEADLMTKAIIASGGKVTPQDFLNNITYGRRAAYGWDNVFTYSILPTLMQEMKGGGSGGARGPGNALMSAYAAVVGGTIPLKALEVWQKLGLIDTSKAVFTKTGAMHGVKPGGIEGADVFQRNPYEWAQTVLLPALQKHGVNSPTQLRETLQYLFPNRTASIMDQMVMQAWKFQRDQKLIRGASGLDAYNQLIKRDPFMAQQALEAQWTNVKTRLGLVILPLLISGTQKLTTVLTALSDWMGKHPKTVMVLVGAFAALSAAMAFGGTVILLSAAFQAIGLALPLVGPAFGILAAGLAAIVSPIGLVVAGIAAFGAACVAIVMNWDKIKGVFSWLEHHIPGMKQAPADVPAAHPWNVPLKKGQWFWAPFSGDGRKMPGKDQWLSPFGSPFVASGGVQKQSFTGDVHMDGQKVGKIVWRHQDAELGRAARQSTGAFDPTMGLAPVSLAYA